MGGSTSKVVSYKDDVKSYYQVPPSVGDMSGLIAEGCKIMVSIISDAIKSNEGKWNDQELCELIQQFNSHSFRMSAFCNEIESCVNRARDSQMNLHAAAQRFKEGRTDGALEELLIFLNSENPFTDLLDKIKEVPQQQEKLAEKLNIYYDKINRKVSIAMIVRIATGFIFTTFILAALLSWKVYAISLRLILTLSVLLAVATPTTITAWVVLDKQCKSYYDVLKRQQDLVGLMMNHGLIEESNFNEIKTAAEETVNLLLSLKGNAQFTLEGEEKVKIGFEHIEKKTDNFAKSIEKLGECVEKCREDLKKGREKIKKKIGTARI